MSIQPLLFMRKQFIAIGLMQANLWLTNISCLNLDYLEPSSYIG